MTLTMSDELFPELRLDDWRSTRDALSGYARVLTTIRQESLPRHPFWWTSTLYVSSRGLTTGSFGDGRPELELDLVTHEALLRIEGSVRNRWSLSGQTTERFFDQASTALRSCGVEVELAMPEFERPTERKWEREAVDRFRRAMSAIDLVLKEFRCRLVGKTSPVHLFGHHFDLSLVWFSGRKIDGEDPSDLELACEQMSFGFSTGDDNLGDPYFYATAYPEPEGFVGSPLPEPARWNRNGFSGAALPYQDLRRSADPAAILARFLDRAHRIGADLMGA